MMGQINDLTWNFGLSKTAQWSDLGKLIIL